MDTQIVLFGLWVVTMLTYLLGDVIRIFAGDYKAGTISGKKVPKIMFLLIAGIMVIPIVMAFLTLVLNQPVNRILNMVVAGFFLLFNLISLRSYKHYDQFLLVISLIFNALVIWYAFGWT